MAAKMTFDDEFNSLNLWNGSSGTWQPVYPWSPNGYQGGDSSSWLVNPNWGPTSSPDADPYSVNNGVLSIDLLPTPASVSSAVNNAPFLSGQLETQPSFSQTYGYFDMRAQMPAGPGLNSAFWLLPESGAWPPELDIEEVVSGDPTTLVNTIHDGPNNSANPMWSTIPDSSQGFHDYAVDWEPDTTTWYFDGKQVAQQPTPADMNQPMYMLVDTLAGTPNSWEGQPNPGETAQMNVDYIRAYDSNPYANGATPASVPTSTNSSSSPDMTTGTSAAGGSSINGDGTTVDLTAPGAANATSGSASDKMTFVPGSSGNGTGDSTAGTASGGGGINTASADRGALAGTGGPGGSASLSGSGDAQLSTGDFSGSSGGATTTSQFPQSAMGGTFSASDGSMPSYSTGGPGALSFHAGQAYFSWP